MTIRNLKPGEKLPEALFVGFVELDPDWVWVAEVDDVIVGALLGTPAHGIFLMLRIIGLPEAPKFWALGILRRSLEDAAQRGFRSYICFLGNSSIEDIKLCRLAARCGAVGAGGTVVFLGGGTDVALKHLGRKPAEVVELRRANG